MNNGIFNDSKFGNIKVVIFKVLNMITINFYVGDGWILIKKKKIINLLRMALKKKKKLQNHDKFFNNVQQNLHPHEIYELFPLDCHLCIKYSKLLCQA